MTPPTADAIRRDFPILSRTLPNGRPVVYLDNAASAQKPRQVIEKMDECAENYYANAYRGVYEFGARIDDELEAARAKIAALIGAREPEEIIFTSGTTMSINLVSNAWGRKFLKPGDEILLSLMEHHANIVPWQQIAREKGAAVRYIPLTPDGRLDLGRLDEVLTDRTRMVALTGMSNVLGTINPIPAIAARAKERGALVLVDGAQSLPHGGTDVRTSGIDFLAFSGHKLYGPTGIGVLYGRRKLLEAMDPFLCGGHMIDEVYLDHSTWAEVPAKFEAGTIPIIEAIGLGAAVDYVNRIGLAAIAAREDELLRYAFMRLGQVPGLRIVGPSVEHRGAITAFVIERRDPPRPELRLLHPHDIADSCNRTHGVAVRAGHHCTKPLHAWLGVDATTRASFGIYNLESEIDVLAEALLAAQEKLEHLGRRRG